MAQDLYALIPHSIESLSVESTVFLKWLSFLRVYGLNNIDICLTSIKRFRQSFGFEDIN